MYSYVNQHLNQAMLRLIWLAGSLDLIAGVCGGHSGMRTGLSLSISAFTLSLLFHQSYILTVCHWHCMIFAVDICHYMIKVLNIMDLDTSRWCFLCQFAWSRFLISPRSSLLQAIGAPVPGYAALHCGGHPLHILLIFTFICLLLMIRLL